MLIVYENEEPENVEAWTEMDRVPVCEKPARGEESSFKLAFDPNMEPCFTAIRQGVQRDSLGIIVASMTSASIWRTKEITHGVSLGSSSSKEFYKAAELKGHKSLVRDVAWAPGNIRGYDIVATACKDGFLRVFQITTPAKAPRERESRDFSDVPDALSISFPRAPENGVPNAPSGIGAGLAGAGARTVTHSERHVREGEIYHVAKEVSKLDANLAPVWRVDFDVDGILLASTGDDGKTTLWRKQPSGTWSKSAQMVTTRGAVA